MIYRLNLILILFSNLFAQQNHSNENLPDNLPIHTKILWGEKGFFRKLHIGPDTRQKELELRLKMLQMHQKIALGTLGAFYYQSYLGNQLLDGKYDYIEKHRNMSKIVWSSYMLSASLSYLAPPGMLYTEKLSSMKIHRLLSWIHFIGMASLPFLGQNISDSENYDAAVRLHQYVAYSTLLTMSLSGLLSMIPY